MKKSDVVTLIAVGGFFLNAVGVAVMQFNKTAQEIALGLNPNMSQMVMTKKLIPDSNTIASRNMAVNTAAVVYMFNAHLGQIIGHGLCIAKNEGLSGLRDPDFLQKIQFRHYERPQPASQHVSSTSPYAFRF